MNTEKTNNPVLLLMSIFNLLRTSALIFEHQATGEVAEFCGDVVQMSEIGRDAANKIWEEVSDKQTLSIAEAISNLIISPDVPKEISEAVEKAVLTIRNSSKRLTEETINKERSPEFISQILRDYEISVDAPEN